METTYLINKKQTGFLLECVSGPCRTGNESISTKDEPSLIQAFKTLRVPEEKIETVLQVLRLSQSTTVTFDAKVMEPL